MPETEAATDLTRRSVTGALALGLLCGAAPRRTANTPLRLETTLANEPLVMRSDARFAGAVSSMVYRGREYVNANDHGRLFQGAIQFGGLGEALNPTQAGGSRDRGASTSRLLEARIGDDSWDVTTQAAYWLRPGDRWTPPGGHPRRASNRTALSDTLITHRHRFNVAPGTRDVAAQAIFTLARPQEFVTVEASTLYAPAEFDHFHALRGGDLIPDEEVLSAPGERPWPTIVSTADGAHAFAYCLPGVTVGYGRGRFPDCSKLNVVFRPSGGLAAGSHTFPASWTVGTRNEVAATLRRLLPA